MAELQLVLAWLRPRRADVTSLALIDLLVDLRSGFTPPEHVYQDHRKIARNLGVLILLDASGSADDSDTMPCTIISGRQQ